LAGNKGIDNWRGRPAGWNPSNTGPKPPSPLPQNYNPNGINNMPGKTMPVSSGASVGSRIAAALIDALGAPGGMARMPLLLLPPGVSECAADPTRCVKPDFDPNCPNPNET